MKKLFIILMLVAGLMFGGAGGCVTQTGTKPDTTSMPSMEYVALDFFDDGKPYYIPSHIDALAPIWMPSAERFTDSILFVHFQTANETMTFVVNDKKLIILAVVYTLKMENGEIIEEYYIYDGKPYPVKVTETEMKDYLDVQKQVEGI